MTLYSHEERMRQLAEKLGVPLFQHTGKTKFPKLHDVRIVDLLPDMMVMVRSLVTEKEFVYRRNPITVMEKGLLVSFQNVFNDRHEDERGLVNKFMQEPPHVRMMPSHVKGGGQVSKTSAHQTEYHIDRNGLFEAVFWNGSR